MYIVQAEVKMNRIAIKSSCTTATCGRWLCFVALVLIGGLAILERQTGSGYLWHFQSRAADVSELWEELAETLSGVRRSCGEVCVTEAGRERARKEPGVWAAELEKEVDCAALFADEDIDADSKFPRPPHKVCVCVCVPSLLFV